MQTSAYAHSTKRGSLSTRVRTISDGRRALIPDLPPNINIAEGWRTRVYHLDASREMDLQTRDISELFRAARERAQDELNTQKLNCVKKQIDNTLILNDIPTELSLPFGHTQKGVVKKTGCRRGPKPRAARKGRGERGRGRPPRKAAPGEAPTLVVGLDAEWRELADGDGAAAEIVKGEKLYRRQSRHRQVLSWQFSVIVGGTAFEFVRLAPDATTKGWGRRPTLSALLLDVLTALYGSRATIPPRLVIKMCAAYGSVDFSAFSGFRNFVTRVDAVRGCFVTLERPLTLRLATGSRNTVAVASVRLYDAAALAAQGTSLSEMGRSLGLVKLDAPRAQMQDFLRDDPDAFVDYAARDATIAAAWVMMVHRELGEGSTIGGISAKAFIRRGAARSGVGVKVFALQWRGLEALGKGEFVPRWPSADASANAAFYGGLNACYIHGVARAAPGSTIGDFDISGAYPRAMGLLEDIDFDVEPVPLTDADFPGLKFTDAAFARVSFEHASARECAIPQKTPYGLVFTVAGEAWASAPEIVLAREIGAKIRILEGYKFARRAGVRSLAEHLSHGVAKRAEARLAYGKGSGPETVWKLSNNGTYGKLAQGLKARRVYRLRHADIEDMPASQLTNAPLAALTTGLVRAFLSATIIECRRSGRPPISATTDGFLADISSEQVEGFNCFGLAEIFRQGGSAVGNDAPLWELKHSQTEVLALATRVQIGAGGTNPVAAAAGVKPAFERLDGESVNAAKARALAALYKNRSCHGGVSSEKRTLPSPRDYRERGADGVMTTTETTRRLIPDFKCRPVPGVRVVNSEHFGPVATFSIDEAWHNVEQFLEVRMAMDKDRTRPGLSPGLRPSDSSADDVSEFVCKSAGISGAWLRTFGCSPKSAAVIELLGRR